MKDDHNKGEGQTRPAPKKSPEKAPGKDPRQDRLKLALRENLKRRKSQARGRSDATIAPLTDDDISPHGEDGKEPGQ
jgi:hypothetical protein